MQAALLVHRHYGGSRRLSEREKRQLETIIAERTQCTKDVWKRNLDTATRALHQLRATERANEELLSSGLAAVRDAVRQQRHEFDAGSRGGGTRSLSPNSDDRRAAATVGGASGRLDRVDSSPADDDKRTSTRPLVPSCGRRNITFCQLSCRYTERFQIGVVSR